MLISSSSNALNEIGTVSTDLFSNIAPYLYLVIGMILGFYITEMIIGIFRISREKDRILDEKVKNVLAQSDALLKEK